MEGRGGANTEQLTTGDDSPFLSCKIEEETTLGSAPRDPHLHRSDSALAAAHNFSRSLSYPLYPGRDGVRIRRAPCPCSPYPGCAADVASNYSTPRQSKNPSVYDADIAWPHLLLPVNPVMQERTVTAHTQKGTRRHRKVPLARRRRGPRRCRSDEPSRRSLLTYRPCTPTPAASLINEKCKGLSTRRNTTGPKMEGNASSHMVGSAIRLNSVVRKQSSAEEEPSPRLFVSDGHGHLREGQYVPGGEFRSAAHEVFQEAPSPQVSPGSIANRQPRRGRGSLEIIPAGRVAARKMELERWMREEKQRRGGAQFSSKTYQRTVTSGGTDVEEKRQPVRWQHSCPPAVGNQIQRLETATLVSDSGSGNAGMDLGRQLTGVAGSVDRSEQGARSPLFASAGHTSCTDAASASFVLDGFKTARFSLHRSPETAPESTYCSARSDAKIYYSRQCRKEGVSSSGNAWTASGTGSHMLRQDFPRSTCSPTKISADKDAKHRHCNNAIPERITLPRARASRSAVADIQEEPSAAVASTQSSIRENCAIMSWSTRRTTQKELEVSGLAESGHTLQSALSARSPDRETVPLEEVRGSRVSVDVLGDEKTFWCDSGDASPPRCGGGSPAKDPASSDFSARSPPRRPPQVPRLELTKIHEARAALYHPVCKQSSTGHPRFGTDPKLPRSRKRRAYPSIRTVHDRTASIGHAANAYFGMGSDGDTTRRSVVQRAGRPVNGDVARQRPQPYGPNNFWLPARSRVVRCSPNLFTARVCTILRKQLHQKNVDARESQFSRKSMQIPQLRHEHSVNPEKHEVICSPAEADIEEEAAKEALFSADRVGLAPRKLNDSAATAQFTRQFMGWWKFSIPLASYWSSSTRPSSSLSPVSRSPDPVNAVAISDEDQPGRAAPPVGEPGACTRSTSVSKNRHLHRRTLGGPRLSSGIPPGPPQTRCGPGFHTVDNRTAASLESRCVVRKEKPVEKSDRLPSAPVTGKTEPSGRVLVQSSDSQIPRRGRMKQVATRQKIGNARVRSNWEAARSFCNDRVPRPIRDHSSRQISASGHKEGQPRRTSVAVTSYKCRSSPGMATFLWCRRLVLSHPRHGEVGHSPDVAKRFSSAQRLSATRHREKAQRSFIPYTGANFF